jgi:HK97 family phage portal protein
MQIGPFTILRTKALPPLSPLDSRTGWWPLIRESFTGAWQQNVEIDLSSIEANPTLFACKTLIAGDLAKMWLRLVELTSDGIWQETTNPAYSPFLRRPNRNQNRLQFVMRWMLSKLSNGNTYVLKERDQRGVVVAGYVLDPSQVTVLVAPDGSAYYQLKTNELAGIPQDEITVPASEIMHDRMWTTVHDLIGVSPIFAAALSAQQGLRIAENSTLFFGNGSNPGGVLTAPGAISDETAARLKAYWDTNYTGANVGKVAVLGDGLKYEPMAQSATDSRLVEQMGMTDQAICSCFHVPGWKVGVGPYPPYSSAEAMNIAYYSDCLQVLIEAFELTLDDGLKLGPAYGNAYGTEFDRHDLFLMDSPTRVKAGADAVGSGAVSPNEARRRYFDLPPVSGGQTPYLQQQYWPLAQLADREIPTIPEAPPPPAPAEDEDEDVTDRMVMAFQKALYAA